MRNATLIRIALGWFLVTMLTAFQNMASAASVIERQGNLFYIANDGASRQLTFQQSDRDPVLAPDGKSLVFLRSKRDKKPDPNDFEGDLWLTDIFGQRTRQLLAMRTSDQPENNLTHMNGLTFSANGKLLYFLTEAWATSDALHVLNMTNGKERFVIDANDVLVVPKGKYENHLVVSRHKYLKQGGSNDLYWLITPEGKEVRMISEDRGQAEKFIANP